MPKRSASGNGLLPREFRTRATADIMLMRAIVGFLGTWQMCDAACRRHKRCASPTVACFDLNREAIGEQLAALAAWPRLDGPRDPEDEDAPVGNLYD